MGEKVSKALENAKTMLDKIGYYLMPRPNEEVTGSINKLLRSCRMCGGYGSKPPIAINWEGPAGPCPICTPLRDWMWKEFRLDFERLT